MKSKDLGIKNINSTFNAYYLYTNVVRLSNQHRSYQIYIRITATVLLG